MADAVHALALDKLADAPSGAVPAEIEEVTQEIESLRTKIDLAAAVERRYRAIEGRLAALAAERAAADAECGQAEADGQRARRRAWFSGRAASVLGRLARERGAAAARRIEALDARIAEAAEALAEAAAFRLEAPDLPVRFREALLRRLALVERLGVNGEVRRTAREELRLTTALGLRALAEILGDLRAVRLHLLSLRCAYARRPGLFSARQVRAVRRPPGQALDEYVAARLVYDASCRRAEEAQLHLGLRLGVPVRSPSLEELEAALDDPPRALELCHAAVWEVESRLREIATVAGGEQGRLSDLS